MDLQTAKPLRMGELRKIERRHAAEAKIEVEGIGMSEQWRRHRSFR